MSNKITKWINQNTSYFEMNNEFKNKPKQDKTNL